MALKPNLLKKNFFFSITGNLFSSLCQWGLIILLARITDASTLGLYGLGGAIATPFYAFFNLHARQYLITDSKSEHTVPQYFQIRFCSSTIAFLLIAITAFFYAGSSLEFFCIILIGISKFVETLSDIYQALFQRYERLDYTAKSISLSGILSLFSFGFGLFFFNSLLVALCGLIASKIVILSLEIFWATRRFAEFSLLDLFSTHWIFPEIWNFFKKTAPLGLMTLLVSLNTNVSRYFLEMIHGTASLGIFTALSYFMYAGTTLCTALAQSSAPQLAKKYQTGDDSFYRLFYSLILFAFGIAIAGVLVSHYFGAMILGLVYGDSFANQSQVLTIFMCAAGFMYLYGYMSIVITTMRYLKVQGVLSILSLSLSTCSCYLLIPELDVLGAAYATLIGSSVYCIGATATVIYGLSKRKAKELSTN